MLCAGVCPSLSLSLLVRALSFAGARTLSFFLFFVLIWS